MGKMVVHNRWLYPQPAAAAACWKGFCKMNRNINMYRYLFAALLLAACGGNENNRQGAASDTAAHVGADMHRNTHMDNAVAFGNGRAAPQQALHQAMNFMMDSMGAYQPTGSADYDFAALMRLHHKSAIEMAQIQLQDGTDSSLRTLAQNIISGQQYELNLFNTYMNANPEATGSSGYAKAAMGRMTHTPYGAMRNQGTDHLFATLMIPHHQDGVQMAEAYLQEGKDAVLIDAAKNIVRTQPREIQQLEQWLNKQPH